MSGAVPKLRSKIAQRPSKRERGFKACAAGLHITAKQRLLVISESAGLSVLQEREHNPFRDAC